MRILHLRTLSTLLAAVFLLCAGSAFAQDGKLKIKVTPKYAHIFVDGKAIDYGNKTLPLSAGKHIVAVVNYGYKISTQDVSIDAGKTTNLDVKLEAYGGNVTGPWGRLEFHGDKHAAILLNGKTQDYYVAHVAETDFDWIWHQELLVPPGKHDVTVTRNGQEIWSGTINVVANQKLDIDLSKNGAQTTKNWGRGAKLAKGGGIPRFKEGALSDTIAVAPATVGSFSASTPQINCGQSTNLSWNTSDAAKSSISGIGDVPASGSQSVSPHQTTDYTLTASGPGGNPTSTATVNVNTAIQATLTANPAELHYRKIGDKVKQQDSTTLTWNATNADSVNIDPVGKVDPSGSQTIQANPKQTTDGPVDETTNYTLNASNVCGGSATQTAPVHIVGSIEPIPTVVLYSIFYPTDYPDSKHPTTGLVKSQQADLSQLAGGFKKYLEYDENAKISVTAFADQRGSKRHNQELSERRVERIKQFLVDQGVAADKIETAAYGADRNLATEEVANLEDANPAKAPKKRAGNKRGNWLAYNRRADIVLLPSGQKSGQYYPHGAADSDILWQVPKPALKKVQTSQ